MRLDLGASAFKNVSIRVCKRASERASRRKCVRPNTGLGASAFRYMRACVRTGGPADAVLPPEGATKIYLLTHVRRGKCVRA